MANEITISGSLKIVNGAFNFNRRIPSTQFDQTDRGFAGNIQNVGDVHEALDMGNVTAAGAFYFLNLSTTYWIQVGFDDGGSFVPVFHLAPNGGFAEGSQLAFDAPYALSQDSSGADLEYGIGQE